MIILNYIKRNLLEDEHIITKANLTNFIYLNELLYLVIIFIYLKYLVIIGISEGKAILSIIPFMVIWIILFFKELIKDTSTELVLTNKRILGRKGFIKIDTLDTPYSSIDNIQVNVSFLGRIFKYGTIIIESKSDSHIYKYIQSPLKLKKRISKEILKNNS